MEPKVITVEAHAEDLYGEMRWPAYATDSDITSGYRDPFLEWDSQKIGDVNYYSGWMRHLAKVDSEQIDEEGVRDDVDLKLVFDLEEETATMELKGGIASAYMQWHMDTPMIPGYGEANQVGSSIETAWCTGSFDESCTFPITYVSERNWSYLLNVSMTLQYYVKVQTSKYPTHGDDRILEKTEIVTEKVRLSGSVKIMGENQVYVTFSMNDYAMEDRNGPAYTLSSQWGSPCTVAEITEWSESSKEEETQVRVTGPDEIMIFSDLLGEKFVLTGWEDLKGVRWVDWVFEYKDEDGGWKELAKVTKEGDISKLETEELDLEAWSTLAASIGTLSGDNKILDARVAALVISDEEKVLATSNTHEFEIVYNAKLRIEAEKEILEVYPNGQNRTRLLLTYGDLNLNEPIKFEAVNPYAGINIEFEPEEINTDLSGVGEITIKIEADYRQFSPSQIDGAPIPVQIRAFSGSLEKIVELQMRPRSLGWLLMFYVAADTADSLQEGDVNNLEKIETALMAGDPYSKPVKVGVTTLIDLNRDWDLGFETLKGGSAYILKSTTGGFKNIVGLGSVNMGDGGLLENYVDTSQVIYPSHRAMLVIVDHGDGMIGVCHDLSHSGSLSVGEIRSALSKPTREIDIVAFDACYMGQLEVAWDLAGYTRYMVASQIAIPGVGLTYPIDELLENPKMSPKQLGETMVDSFIMPKARSHQLALIDCSATEVLVEKMRVLAENLIKVYGKNVTNTVNIVSDAALTSIPVKHPFYDLQKFAESLGDSDDLDISLLDSVDVMDSLSQVVLKNKAVIYDGSGKTISNPGFNGLSFFLWPSSLDAKNGRTYNTYMEYYDRTEFSKMTRWKEFIDMHRLRCVAMRNTYLSLLQNGNELYPHVFDDEGRHIGRNPDHWSKTKLDLEIPGASYFDFGNGTKVIVLPGDLDHFTFKVDGMSMKEAEESYRLTYSFVEGDEVIYEDLLENPIEEYSNHTISIQLEGQEISLGEVIVEKKAAVTVKEDEPQPPSGIPGFPYLALAIGLLIIMINLGFKKRLLYPRARKYDGTLAARA